MNPNPAQEAAQKALASVFECIDNHICFRLEAGAGAGKTHSLVEALRYLIKKHGKDLRRNQQQIACITYTNIASEQIKARLDGHPAILSSTIHALCWSLVKDLQKHLRSLIPQLENWPERIADAGGIDGRRIVYDKGYPRAAKDERHLSLGHNDVIALMVMLLKEPKFRSLFSARYPVILIDEYQDTDKAFSESLKSHFIGMRNGPQNSDQ